MGEQHAHPPVIHAAGSALPGQPGGAGRWKPWTLLPFVLSGVPCVVAVGLFSAPALSVMALCICDAFADLGVVVGGATAGGRIIVVW